MTIIDEIMPMIPVAAANGLIGIANMVVPQFLSSAQTIPNFAGPQPGNLGGGVSPTATPANPTVISGKMLDKKVLSSRDIFVLKIQKCCVG